eukprot:3912466-Alexandrium_andersonii.AAC.1
MPRSKAMEAMPMPSAAPFTMPANSASPELSAIVFCVVDQCLTVRAPRIQTPPPVERLVRRRPANCQGKL